MLSLCSSLQSGLSELTAAMQKYQSDSERGCRPTRLKIFVSSPSKIYDETCIINKIKIIIIRFFRKFKRKFSPPTFKEAINTIIHKLFDEVIAAAYQVRQQHLIYNIQQIEEHFKLDRTTDSRQAIQKRYFTYLQDELRGANVSLGGFAEKFNSQLNVKKSEHDLVAFRKLIVKVSEAVFPFWHQMIHYKRSFRVILQNFLPETFAPVTKGNLINGAINELRLLQALRKEQDLNTFQALLGKTPLIELIKICQPHTPLDIREKKRLNKWISDLNKYMTNENDTEVQKIVELLKNTLLEVVKAVEIQGQLNVSMGLLVNKLDDYGCKLMRLEDPRHRMWRRNLKKGKLLICNGQSYTLGDEISTKRTVKGSRFKARRIAESDRYRVFSVENQPGLIIKIGKNPFDLFIDSCKFKDYHFGIPSADGVQKVVHTSDGHAVIISEFLPLALSDYHWTTNQAQLTAADLEIASRIASVLFCWYDAQVWPNSISFEHLFISHNRWIKITEWLDCGKRAEVASKDYCGPDNYLAAEEFCARAARAGSSECNPYLLHYFMQVSGYSKHPLALFYRECVTTMLKTGEFDFHELSMPYGYNHPLYRKKVNDLFDQVKELRKQCIYEVQEYYEKKDDSFKNEKIALIAREKEIQAEKLTHTKNTQKTVLNDFNRKNRKLQRDKEEFEDKKEEAQAKQLAASLQSIQQWKYFAHKKDSFSKKITHVRQEYISIKNELNEAVNALKVLKKCHLDSSVYEREKERCQNLKSIKQTLALDEESHYQNIIKITACELLIEAYLESATPSLLADSLVKKVMENFKNPGVSPPFLLAHDYYEQQRQLLLAKNRYAIENNLVPTH